MHICQAMNRFLFYDNDIKIVEAFKNCIDERRTELDLVSQFHDLLSKIGPKKYQAIVLNLEKKPSEGEICIKELIHVIKKLEPELPIIVTTEKCSLDIEKEIRTAGIFFYMVKPFNQEEIKSVINEILTKSQNKK